MKFYISMAGPLARLTTALMLSASGSAYAADIPAVAPVDIPETQAMERLSGVFGLYGALTFSDNSEDNNWGGDGWLVGGDARANYWWSDSISTQFDLWGEAGSVDASEDGCGNDCDPDEEYSRVNAAVGGHLTWRDPNRFALGVLGGITGGSVFDEGSQTRYFVGIEGQLYFGDFTLYGQAGYHDWISGDSDHDEMAEAWWARAIGRWYFTPRDKIEAEFGVSMADNNQGNNNGDIRMYNWGALYEHQYMNSPFSAYFEYNGYDTLDESHNCCGGNFVSDDRTEHIFMIGGRLNFNQPDLITADRYGVTLDMPELVRQSNWANINHDNN